MYVKVLTFVYLIGFLYEVIVLVCWINFEKWKYEFLNLFHLNLFEIFFSHGHDKISIRMLKLSDKAICKPLHMIFTSCLETGVFPIHWKKANVVPIHKKESKQLVKSYRPVSLLPICSKVFERLIYNEVYPYLIDNNLISSHQSGFKGGDSCINQLLLITHEIYKSFDEGFEVRGVFLDISKAFDRVWHDGLIFKLQENGISGKLLLLLKDFLKFRKQRVVLNG